MLVRPPIAPTRTSKNLQPTSTIGFYQISKTMGALYFANFVVITATVFEPVGCKHTIVPNVVLAGTTISTKMI